ncbi:MAG: FixH family protein [Alphaproteobacteria bacterium]|nr:FixH family protein [Alphaproteobacteria bacterium]
MTFVVRLMLLAALSTAASPAFACDPPSLGASQKVVDSRNYRIAWRVRPDPIAVSEPFALEISVCANPGAEPVESIAVDAVMPEHRHGMNYRPSVIDGPDGRYLVEGMLFHMPGTWRLIFDVRAGGATEQLTQDLTVE